MWSLIMRLVRRGKIVKEQKEQFVFSTEAIYLDYITRVECVYPYGMKSSPMKGGPILMWAVQGKADSIAGTPYTYAKTSKLPDLKEGEVSIGHPIKGNYVHFLSDGGVVIKAEKNIMITGDVTITGKLTVSGDIDGGEVSVGTIKLSEHRHDSVTSGVDISGGPVV